MAPLNNGFAQSCRNMSSSSRVFEGRTSDLVLGWTRQRRRVEEVCWFFHLQKRRASSMQRKVLQLCTVLCEEREASLIAVLHCWLRLVVGGRDDFFCLLWRQVIRHVEGLRMCSLSHTYFHQAEGIRSTNPCRCSV